MNRAQILSVPRGSVIVLHDVVLDDESAIAESLRKAVGHDEFVILCTYGDGRVRVITDPDDFPAWLARQVADPRQRILDRVRPKGPVAPSVVRSAASLRR